MSLKKYGSAVLVAIVLVLGVISGARAWPDLPPTKAFMSGPGIKGQVEITDPVVLATLRLGSFEDLTTGAIQSPNVAGDGYDITRYFDGDFNFAELLYYPGSNGAKSYVYWKDGVELSGDHTPFNNQWLYVTAQGDEVMQKFLHETLASDTAPMLARVPGASPSLIAFDAVSLRPRFVLPNGVGSADGKHYYAAFDSMGMTAVHGFDLKTGTIQSSFALDGAWSLSRVSANGAWLAFTANVSDADKTAMTQSNGWKTNIAIVEAASGKISRNTTLDGNFEVDALNSNGTSLFLIEHSPAVNPTDYRVRLYDLTAGQLQVGAIVDKREPDEVMVGYPWDAVATPEGTWLLTLYLKTNEQSAFIHALNLANGYAWCINLPGRGSTDALKNYTLALSPEGRTMYAINSALGSVSVLNVGDPDVSRTIPFAPSTTASQTTDSRFATNHSLVSKDGMQVYFTDGHLVWVFDVGKESVEPPIRPDKPLIGIAEDAGGQVYVANADQTLSPLSVKANALLIGGR